MPNVLAHVGAQGPVSRFLSRTLDPRWIYLGLFLPDIPWVVRRAVTNLPVPVDPYAARLYAHAQASLAISLLLAAAIAFLTRRPTTVFGILSLNVFLHLLVDGTQRKWGNGVHLWAPLDWDLWSLDLYWPENPLVYVLSVAGVLFLLWEWLQGRGRTGSAIPPPGFVRNLRGMSVMDRSGLQLVLAGLLLLGYVTAPLLAVDTLWERDFRSTRTLAIREGRTGHRIEIDRTTLRQANGSARIKTSSGEQIVVRGDLPEGTALVSLRGRFVAPDTLRVLDVHQHHGRVRDHLSYVGLLCLLLVWVAGAGSSGQGASRNDGSAVTRG